ncbi:MAG: VOC family protein [Anaerolineaceae bacterium]|nr:VOC family protein [Anaerolineaceae bacterium]
MLKGIDHLVIGVHDLEATTESYRELGFTVSPGGKHPAATYNSLIGFQDGSYIELLGFYETAPEHPWWDLLHNRGGGLIDFCMQTDDIHSDYAQLKAAGVTMTELTDLSRVRPDGYELAWINNKVKGVYQGLVPFIIEDKTPRDERVPKERAHNNGVVGIDTLTLIASDLDLVQRVYTPLLGHSGTPTTDADLDARGMVYTFGPHKLRFLTPNSASSPLAAHLSNHAPVLYQVSLVTHDIPGMLSLTKTQGARLMLVSA